VVKIILQQAALPPHMDGSMVFARWGQCAAHVIHASALLQGSRQTVTIPYNGLFPFPLNIVTSYGGSWTPI